MNDNQNPKPKTAVRKAAFRVNPSTPIPSPESPKANPSRVVKDVRPSPAYSSATCAKSLPNPTPVRREQTETSVATAPAATGDFEAERGRFEPEGS